MSRSRRKSPITGHTTCRSERQDKKNWHQLWRARERTTLAGAYDSSGLVGQADLKLQRTQSTGTLVIRKAAAAQVDG